MEKKNSISTIFIIAVVLLVVIAAAAKITSSKSSKTEEGTGTAAMTEYWTEGSAPAQELRDYVSKVTNPDDKENFIPEKDRIAVFDMDGTLVCETYYTYYRKLHCPKWQSKRW